MNSITITDNKNFMKKLLAADTFDGFLLEEALITTYNTFVIDGHIVEDFYTTEERELMKEETGIPSFSSWGTIRPICFDLVKGKKTPVNFKFVLHAGDAIVQQLVQDEKCTVSPEYVKSLVLTVRYDGTEISCISATALTTFIMDKSLDALWDHWVEAFVNTL